MAKTENIRVVLVASGRTAWDEAGRIGGACDLPLTPAGKTDLQALFKPLHESRLATILSAPDECSCQTAEAVAASADPAAPAPRIKRIDALSDVCMGLWEGLRAEEIQEKFPKAYRQWREDPQALVIPEAETLDEAQQRLVQALSSALGRVNGDGAVALVLRPMALTVVRCWLESAPLRSLWSMLNDAVGLRWETIERSRLRRKPPVRISA
jgi:probable phosphoglycerate mutase